MRFVLPAFILWIIAHGELATYIAYAKQGSPSGDGGNNSSKSSNNIGPFDMNDPITSGIKKGIEWGLGF